ncbi:MAG: glutathione S-transferase family protein [Alphaproteobacteria bacterium]
MRTLYHLWLSPFSRKVRVALAEKRLECQLQVEKVWERRPEFLALNPAGCVPVLVEEDGHVLADSYAICEYLDEMHEARPLFGTDPRGRAEARRLVAWFDTKFAREVSELVLREKFMKRFLGLGQPEGASIRAGLANLHYHLDYIGFLAERRNWLAGDQFTLADIAAGAHVSCIDYLGDVPWDDHQPAREWYARLKSQPSFRAILADHIPGVPPPKHYADPDF